MKRSYFLLFIFLVSLWGCPTRKQVPQPPPPKPPEPQIEQAPEAKKPQSLYQLPQGGYVMIVSQQQQLAYDWMDVIEILKGMAPLVGPAPWFFRMMA